MKITITNNIKILAVVAVIICALIGWIVWRAHQTADVTNLDSTGTTIVAFGDSLIYGYGSTEGNDFVSLLSQRTGQPIINMGHNGDTTADGLARLGDVLAKDPKIVILLLGGNDFLHKVPVDTTFTNLGKIIAAIQAHGSAVLLLGVRGGLLSDGYASHFSDLAKIHHTAFVPNVLDGLLGHQEYMYDAIHPNDVGYGKVADKVEPVLKTLLRGK